MNKKYIVRLSKQEREELTDVVKRLKGSSQKVRRAQILLKADVRGPNWTDAKIAEAFSCRVQTVENLRKRLVTEGFQDALDGKPRETPPRQKMSGRQAGGEGHRDASGQATQRICQLVASTAGGTGGRTRAGRVDQPRNHPPDA